MNKKNILQHIPLSCYIKLYLLEQKIFQKIRIYHNQNFTLVNYILHDYPKFHYKLNKHYMIVSHQDNLNLINNIAFKSCHNQSVLKNNPCRLFNQEHDYPNGMNQKNDEINEKKEEKNVVYYNIIVGYKQLLESQLTNKNQKNKNMENKNENKNVSKNENKNKPDQIKFKEKKSSKKNKDKENVVELKSLNLQNPSIKKIKLLTPNNLIQLKCSQKSSTKNKNILKKIVSNIEKALMKNPLLKKSISYVILEEHKYHQKPKIINIG